MKIQLTLGVMFTALSFLGCKTVPLVESITLIGFEEDVTEGESVGFGEGLDCSISIHAPAIVPDHHGRPTTAPLYMRFGDAEWFPAMDNFRQGIKEGKEKERANPSYKPLRYANNVSFGNKNHYYGVFSKNCRYVSGTGFK